jgi:hypothetical protein
MFTVLQSNPYATDPKSYHEKRIEVGFELLDSPHPIPGVFKLFRRQALGKRVAEHIKSLHYGTRVSKASSTRSRSKNKTVDGWKDIPCSGTEGLKENVIAAGLLSIIRDIYDYLKQNNHIPEDHILVAIDCQEGNLKCKDKSKLRPDIFG